MNDDARLGVPLPPVLFLGFLVLGGVLQLVHPLTFLPAGSRLGIVVAVLAFLAAITLAVSAFRTMSRAKTTHHPRGTPTALVSSGPFRFTRNPLYISLLLVLTAFAFAFDSLWVLLGVPALLLVLDRFIVRREEATLGKHFGEGYADYRKRVRRWV